MINEIQPLKDDESQHPIPNVWRHKLCVIVEAIKDGNFQLSGVAGVRQLPLEAAATISKNIENYGVHLTSLPEDTWGTSVCQWMRGYWDALIDLYTIEEGLSDLALFVRVRETAQGYEFEVGSLAVP